MHKTHLRLNPALTALVEQNKTPLRGVAYNGTVTVTDPEHSIFDVQL